MTPGFRLITLGGSIISGLMSAVFFIGGEPNSGAILAGASGAMLILAALWRAS